MSNSVDELGPVDWIVVEFPGNKFNGEIAPHLVDLVDRGIIRVLDLLVLTKDEDGSIEGYELADLDDSEIGQLRTYEAELAMLLSEDDVAAIAEAVHPGSSAAVLVFENTWQRRSRLRFVTPAGSWSPAAASRPGLAGRYRGGRRGRERGELRCHSPGEGLVGRGLWGRPWHVQPPRGDRRCRGSWRQPSYRPPGRPPDQRR